MVIENVNKYFPTNPKNRKTKVYNFRYFVRDENSVRLCFVVAGAGAGVNHGEPQVPRLQARRSGTVINHNIIIYKRLIM